MKRTEQEEDRATYSHYLGVLTLDRKVQCRLLVNVLYVQISISLWREKEQINRLTSEKYNLNNYDISIYIDARR